MCKLRRLLETASLLMGCECIVGKGLFRSKLADQETTLELQNHRRSPAQIDGKGAIIFYREGGRLSVTAGQQFFLAPPPFTCGKKIWSPPIAYGEKFWSPPLWPAKNLVPPLANWKKTGSPSDHPKNSGPPSPLQTDGPPPGKKL